jgi:hypothetical protein
MEHYLIWDMSDYLLSAHTHMQEEFKINRDAISYVRFEVFTADAAKKYQVHFFAAYVGC